MAPLSNKRKAALALGVLGLGYLLTNDHAKSTLKGAAKAVGLPVRDMSLPRGLRNNNPLNLRKGVKWAGRVGDDGAFDIFGTMLDGMRAAIKNVHTSITVHHTTTVAKLIARWAPASDGNNVQAYVNDVCTAAGVSPTYLIDLTNREVVAKIVRAMAVHENGKEHAAKLPPLNDWIAATRVYA